MCLHVQFIGIVQEGCVVMCLGPLYLLEWTAMDVVGPGGQFYIILFILFVVDPQLGFQ